MVRAVIRSQIAAWWQQPQSRGILLMLMSCFGASVMVTIVRYLSADLPSTLIVFYRSAFALFWFVPWLLWTGFRHIQKPRMRLYMLRGCLGMIAMQLWFFSLTVVELPLATALSFTSPLMTALLAVVMFKEKAGKAVWISMGIGFLGAVVILRPGFDSFNPNALLVMATAALWSTSGVIIKSLTRTQSPVTVCFYLALVIAPLSLIIAIPQWQWVYDARLIFWLAMLGLVSNLFQIAMSYAIATTDLVTILPYDFSRLLFVSVLAYFTFGETLDLITLAGAAIILGSAVYATQEEKRKLRAIAKAAEQV